MFAKAGKADICRGPLFPQKRTFVAVIYMSALCQKRTSLWRGQTGAAFWDI
jgi:hypothetical protein